MQQINLNRPELWPKPTPFPARFMALALLAAGAVLGIGLAALEYRQEGAAARLEDARQERQRVQTHLNGLRQAHESRRGELSRLRKEVTELKDRTGTLRRARKAMERRLTAAGSKAELVRALGRARAGMPDIWLTRFALTGVDEVAVELEGRARIPESIPRYLQAVADQTVFRKGFFEDLSAEAPEERTDGLLRFSSRTRFKLDDAREAAR
ncbi:hypothetical protein [Thiohalorhabdus methylotrophus]|uniref:MSHA biogenesis protein MshI n=1 Tax=Thiohalorhabdus methylotrophus TaxID=3242694 RepID=A0ABV4TZ05_9GAMM